LDWSLRTYHLYEEKKSMTVKSLGVMALLGVALAVAVPMWAHHSHGNYDMEVYTNLTGTIKEAHFLNPHSWVYIEVKDKDDKVTMWALEGTSPAGLRRRGWDLAAFKPGVTISARCHQLRDKSPGCLLGFITLDGVERSFD
jgi:hypothetical protein